MEDPSIAGLEYWFSRSERYHELLVDGPAGNEEVIPVQAVLQSELSSVMGSLDPLHRSWANTSRFKAGSGEVCLVPDTKGGLARVLLGLGSPSAAPWPYAALGKLPAGTYRLTLPPAAAGADDAHSSATAAPADAQKKAAPDAAVGGSAVADRAALGFLLGHYAFERYKKPKTTTTTTAATTAAAGGRAEGGEASGGAVQGKAAGAEVGREGAEEEGAKARLVWPEGSNRQLVRALARSFVWCRDLITTPAEDLGPQHLAAEAAALAAAHQGGHSGSTSIASSSTTTTSFRLVQDEQLLAENYPAIHTVGRASYRPPLLASLEWSPPGHPDPSSLPLVALVGKGVCFDTGGLNLKPAASMKNMKKDMGGAALVLALAQVVMSVGLPVRLLVLLPAVENSVAGNAYRPLDVLKTRAGITVENGNTDAEGRLILSDALAAAASRRPDLLLDAATLTGAARVALGPDLPAVFTNADDVWRQLEVAAKEESDPLWRLPLHAPYRKLLDSRVADLSSTGSAEGMAGAVVAALFLQEFTKGADRWVHIDTGAYTTPASSGPGRPEGGEAQALRALWRMLQDRYGSEATSATAASTASAF